MYVANIRKIYKWLLCITVIIVFLTLGLYIKYYDLKQKQTESILEQARKIEKSEDKKILSTNQEKNTEPEKSVKKKTATLQIPKDYEGWQVIGRLDIPKIKLTTYILNETTKDTLNKSVTKFCGPEINKVGNFCITGHNYRKQNMFSNLRKLEVGDEFSITDMYERSISYKIYSITQVDPSNVQCLEQETGGEREVTLITCTIGALKRLIIKAVEIYD